MPSSGARWAILGGAGIVVLLAAYANALNGPFQFDDWNVIVESDRKSTRLNSSH